MTSIQCASTSTSPAAGGRNTSRARAQAGFSLMEIMVVVAIMGLLSSMVAIKVSSQSRKARCNAAKGEIGTIGNAIEAYHLDTGRYPQSLAGLTADDGIGNWGGPYLRKAKEVPVDPWATPYTYELEAGGSDYRVCAKGDEEYCSEVCG
ncbi:MAG: type II secretion system protein GspG [Candidatus Schekmanbacteria bacterium]|nr:type II secretion system protein GspG [Candidatus Schekmanbacteria bacterium]